MRKRDGAGTVPCSASCRGLDILRIRGAAEIAFVKVCNFQTFYQRSSFSLAVFPSAICMYNTHAGSRFGLRVLSKVHAEGVNRTTSYREQMKRCIKCVEETHLADVHVSEIVGSEYRPQNQHLKLHTCLDISHDSRFRGNRAHFVGSEYRPQNQHLKLHIYMDISHDSRFRGNRAHCIP